MNPFVYQPETEDPKKIVKPPARGRSRGLSRSSPNSAPAPSNSRPELNKLTSTKLVSGSNKNTRRMTMLLPATIGNSPGFLGLRGSTMPDPEPVEANDAGLRSRGESQGNDIATRGPSVRPPPPSISMLRKKETDAVDDGTAANSEQTKRSRTNSNVKSQYQSQQSATKPKVINSRMSMLPPRRPPQKKSSQVKITSENDVDKTVQKYMADVPVMFGENNYNLEEDVLSAVASIIGEDLGDDMPSMASQMDPKEERRSERRNPPSSNYLPAKDDYVFPSVTDDITAAVADDEYVRPNDKKNNVVTSSKDSVLARNFIVLEEPSSAEFPTPPRSPVSSLPVQTGIPSEPLLDLALEELLAGEFFGESLSNSPVLLTGESVPELESTIFQNLLLDESQDLLPNLDFTAEESTTLSEMNRRDGSQYDNENEDDQNEYLSNNGVGSPIEEDWSEDKAIVSNEGESEGETFQATMNKLESNDKQGDELKIDVDDFMAFLASVASDLEASQADLKSTNEALSDPMVITRSEEEVPESPAETPDTIQFTPGEELVQSQSPQDESPPHSPIILKVLDKSTQRMPPISSPAVLTPVDAPELWSQEVTKPERSASLRSKAQKKNYTANYSPAPTPAQKTQKARQPSSTISTLSDFKPFVAKIPKRSSSIMNPASNINFAEVDTSDQPTPAKSIQSNVTRVVNPEQPASESSTLILKSLGSSPSPSEKISENSGSGGFDDDLFATPSEGRQSVLASQSFLEKFNLLMASGDDTTAPKSPNVASSGAMDSYRDMESMI